MNPDTLITIFSMLAAAGAVYGGIRSDIKHMMERIEKHERAIERLQERIDTHMPHGVTS